MLQFNCLSVNYISDISEKRLAEINTLNSYFTKSKIFLYIMLSFSLGVWLAKWLTLDSYSQNILITFAVTLIIISILFIKEKIIVVSSVCLLIIGFGAIYTADYKAKHQPQYLAYNEEVNFEGVIIEEPDQRTDNTKITIKVTKADGFEELISQKILVTIKRYPEYFYGDTINIVGKLEKPEVINGFDYGSYLERYQIHALITKPKEVNKISSNNGNKLKSQLLTIKKSFKKSIEKSLPEPESSLAEGIVLGVKGNFSQDLKDKLSQTGTTHIVVVSGQNMEVITSTFVNLTKYWPGLMTFWVGIVGIICYIIITGASASVVRAGILAMLFLLARLLGRRKQILIPLVLTGTVMVTINPLILRSDLGFQLSFLAMLGLIFISPIFSQLFSKLPKFINESLAATIGAQIATLPIILYNFGQLSILAPITNALILFAIPTAMGLSFITGLLGIVSYQLGIASGWVAWILLKYVIMIIDIFSQISWASNKVEFKNSFIVMLLYILVAIGVNSVNKKYISRSKSK
ncbi:MAG: hypothetical protein ACD_58C00008G0003 [uncultured bacterium]|nr:MAG: hypothetical protein ACD_58C00008G0003 [uncultured bacterium]